MRTLVFRAKINGQPAHVLGVHLKQEADDAGGRHTMVEMRIKGAGTEEEPVVIAFSLNDLMRMLGDEATNWAAALPERIKGGAQAVADEAQKKVSDLANRFRRALEAFRDE